MLDEWYLVFRLLRKTQNGITYLGKPGLVCEVCRRSLLSAVQEVNAPFAFSIKMTAFLFTWLVGKGWPKERCLKRRQRSLTENVNSWNQTKNRYGRNPNQAQVLAPDHVIYTISFPFAAREETYPQNPAEAPHRMMQGGKNLNCPPSLFEAKWNVSGTMDSRDAAAAGEPQILSSALAMALFFDCWTE
ncbi:hypothetical protein TNCV_5096131 [Trichonephila clavipes]|nr:hypothetical protein TNCV_5096131 [Trichonephila clavipes]